MNGWPQITPGNGHVFSSVTSVAIQMVRRTHARHAVPESIQVWAEVVLATFSPLWTMIFNMIRCGESTKTTFYALFQALGFTDINHSIDISYIIFINMLGRCIAGAINRW